MTLPLAVRRFTAASTSASTDGDGVTGASCESVQGTPIFSRVFAAADLLARSAPHSRTTPSPAVTMPAERKVGTAPTFFMRSIWSGRMKVAWMNTGRWSRMPCFSIAFSMARSACSTAASPFMCMLIWTSLVQKRSNAACSTSSGICWKPEKMPVLPGGLLV